MLGLHARRGVAAALAGVVFGGLAGPPARAYADTIEQTAPRTEVVTRADRLEYDGGLLRLSGNAMIRRVGIDEELRADRIVLNEKTGDVVATGAVRYREGDKVWEGPRFNYNLNDGTASQDTFTLQSGPVFVSGGVSERAESGEFLVQDVTITTCEPDDPNPEYRVRSRRVRYWPDDVIKGYGTTLYLGKVPVFWTPFWWKNLKADSGWHFEPGLNSRHGAFLLSTYRTGFGEAVRSETHIDYRVERGLGLGQDFAWRDPSGGGWEGYVKAYLAQDDKPYESGEVDDGLVEDERYRVKLSHSEVFGPRAYGIAKLHYVSDPDVLEDFFSDESRSTPVPENYVSWTHRDDDYTLNLLLQTRVNDFYESVVREPQASVSLPRQRLGASALFYEGETSIGFLERRFAEGSGATDYDTMRADSAHLVLMPTKQQGFLTVIPRVGYRGTYYGASIDRDTVTTVTDNVSTTQVVVGMVTNEIISVDSRDTNTSVVISGGGTHVRNLVELGVATSFKMFRVLDDDPRFPLRHVVEPYVDYTFVNNAGSSPDEIYQFDGIDALDEYHGVHLGVRNKIQTKRAGTPYDLIDVNVNTVLFLEEPDSGERLGDLFADAELRLWERAAIDLDARYDVEDSTLESFNAQARMGIGGPVGLDLEFRHRDGDSSLVSGRAIYRPGTGWELGGYGRYELDDAEVEEVSVDLLRTMDCLAWKARVGLIPSHTRSDGSTRDDEVYASVELWLTAFPQLGIGGD